MAARTLIDPFGERHLLAVPTPTAILARVGRVHRHAPPTGACSLVGEERGEHRPRGVTNALGETMVMHHAVDAQVLNRDGAVLVDDLARLLVREVLAPVRDALMHA